MGLQKGFYCNRVLDPIVDLCRFNEQGVKTVTLLI